MVNFDPNQAVNDVLSARISQSDGLARVADAAVDFLNVGPSSPPLIGTATLLNAIILAGVAQIEAKGEYNSSSWFAEWLLNDADYRDQVEKLKRDAASRRQGIESATQKWLDKDVTIDISDALGVRLGRAHELAMKTVGRSRPDLRHVLAVLLKMGDAGTTVPSPFLDRTIANRFFERFFGYIQKFQETDERLDVWSDFFGPTAENLREGPRLPAERDTSTAPPDRAVARVAGDLYARVWSEAEVGPKGLIDIDSEVTAFARLIAARDTSPPLSIGLFGEWGSGKSYFMERIQERVRELSEREDQKDPKVFHPYIVQIRFNAWHYIESNLWASLVEHIFRELDLWLRSSKRGSSEQLFKALATSKRLRLEAAQLIADRLKQKERAQTEMTQAQAQLKTAADARPAVSPALLWKSAVEAFADALKKDPKAGEIRKALTEDLGEVAGEAHVLAGLVEEARDSAARGRLLQRTIVTRLGKDWRVWLGAVALVAAPALAGWTLSQLPMVHLQAFWAEAGAVLSVLIGSARWLIGRGNETLAKLDGFRVRLDAAVQDAGANERKRVAAAETNLAVAQAAVVEAETRFAAATADAMRAEQEFLDETAHGRLNRFIRERVEQAVYSKHLSLIATIRKDFGQLTDIMAPDLSNAAERDAMQQLNAASKAKIDEFLEGEGSILPKPIQDQLQPNDATQDLRYFNRIVLYIDDLDRCSHDKVAEVLQAIHLLLFFRLFVVVVAVDARWMANSLQQHYSGLLFQDAMDGGPKDAGGGGENASAEAIQPHRSAGASKATAQDYIEKIFQIPFWVQEMDRDTAKRFVRGLAGTRAEMPSSNQGQDGATVGTNAGDGRRAEKGGSVGTGGGPAGKTGVKQGAGDARTDPPSVASAKEIPVSALSFSKDEMDVLDLFAPLFAVSPRRAKRVMNVYQVVKTALSVGIADGAMKWGSESSLATLCLLSVLDADRKMEHEFFKILRDEATPIRSFDDFASRMPKECGIDLSLSEPADPLAAAAKGCRDKQLRADAVLAEMRVLAPIVRRFSFDSRL